MSTGILSAGMAICGAISADFLVIRSFCAIFARNCVLVNLINLGKRI